MRENKLICVFDGPYMENNTTENAIMQRTNSENMHISQQCTIIF